VSLRLRLFIALSVAALVGGLATGLYAVLMEKDTLGFSGRLLRVAPKGFLVGSALLPLLAGASAWVGSRLARPVERLSDAAARIAEGEQEAGPLRPGSGAEAVKLARALSSLGREIADRPYAAAFLRDAWHDLKTPVAALKATLEVLEDGAIDDPPAARRFVANLRRSTEQLDRLLEDLVTLARFETASLADPEDVDLLDVCRAVLARSEPLAEARGVTVALHPEGNVRTRADRGALARALSNLVENAVRAVPRGGTVSVQARAEGNTLVVLVANEPALVAREIRDRLFQRSALAARKGIEEGDRGGSGLGLAIARAAILAHGGTVRFVEMGPPRVVVRVELPR
jgi:signal transduction histidine kinase